MLNVNKTPDWQNLSVLSVNRVPSRAYFIPYKSEEECLAAPFFCDRKEIKSDRFLLLNGDWHFSYFRSVAFLPENIFDLEGKEIPVPSVWQTQGCEDWNYVNIDYPFPLNPPEVPNHNPVGIYSRKFTLPKSFDGKTVTVNFLGVASAFHLFINRKKVGYGQVSRSTNEFDITPYLVDGENEITVEVYKWCDGNYLEDQDIFRFNGIFRDVFLLAQPKAHIEDFFFKTETDDLKTFRVKTDVSLSEDAEVTLKLFSPDNSLVYTETKKSEKNNTVFEFTVENPELWNAEKPKCHTLLLSTKDEAIKQIVGFKRAEIQDSVLYLNGSAIKIKGVNRHDSDPFVGSAVPFEHIRKDLELIKSLNCNTVRTSHYPNDPVLVAMANFMGLYIVAEADLETHGFRNLKTDELDWSVLSQNPEWKNAYLDRIEKSVERDKNNPCILFWSLGNESGDGENLRDMEKYVHERIPGSIVHYCEFKNPKDQIYSEMYPEFAKVEEMGENKNNDPSIYFMCEYAHSMGIGPGSFKEYMDLVYKYPRIVGGCVWEWCDHAKGVKQSDGSVNYLYGGDNGDWPNNGNFCCDGIVLPDRTFSTGAYEMKEAYAPFRTNLENGVFEIENVLDFTNAKEYTFRWVHTVDGAEKEKGEFSLEIPPHKKAEFRLPEFDDEKAIISAVDISYIRNSGGENCGGRSFAIKTSVPTFSECRVPLAVTENGNYIEFSSDLFAAEFSLADGTFVSYKKDGVELLKEGYVDGWEIGKGTNLFTYGPRLGIRRAMTDNDIFIMQTDEFGDDKVWNKINTAEITEKSEVSAKISVTGNLGCPMHTVAYIFDQTFTVYGDGRIEIYSHIKPGEREKHAFLGRVGLRFSMPKAFENVRWLGLGERENYSDFRLSARYGQFESTITDLGGFYIKPQECGNRSECRVATVTDGDGFGFEITGDGFNFGGRHATIEEVSACKHHFEVPSSDLTEVYVDGFMSGLGSNSCGPRPLPEYILDGNKEYSFTVTLRGISKRR